MRTETEKRRISKITEALNSMNFAVANLRANIIELEKELRESNIEYKKAQKIRQKLEARLNYWKAG